MCEIRMVSVCIEYQRQSTGSAAERPGSVQMMWIYTAVSLISADYNWHWVTRTHCFFFFINLVWSLLNFSLVLFQHLSITTICNFCRAFFRYRFFSIYIYIYIYSNDSKCSHLAVTVLTLCLPSRVFFWFFQNSYLRFQNCSLRLTDKNTHASALWVFYSPISATEKWT